MGLAENRQKEQPLVNKWFLQQSRLRKSSSQTRWRIYVAAPFGKTKACLMYTTAKQAELETALLQTSENGKYPVLCDQSPCLYRMRHHQTTQICTSRPNSSILFCKTSWNSGQLNPLPCITCSMKKNGTGQIESRHWPSFVRTTCSYRRSGMLWLCWRRQRFHHPEVNATH